MAPAKPLFEIFPTLPQHSLHHYNMTNANRGNFTEQLTCEVYHRHFCSLQMCIVHSVIFISHSIYCYVKAPFSKLADHNKLYEAINSDQIWITCWVLVWFGSIWFDCFWLFSVDPAHWGTPHRVENTQWRPIGPDTLTTVYIKPRRSLCSRPYRSTAVHRE